MLFRACKLFDLVLVLQTNIVNYCSYYISKWRSVASGSPKTFEHVVYEMVMIMLPLLLLLPLACR